MGEQFIAHLDPTPELTRWARRYLRARRPRARVWKIHRDEEKPWHITIPGDRMVYCADTFAAAIEFATTKGTK